MRDLIKKSFLLGLGAATITKQQAERVINELVKNKAVTVKESKVMLKKVKKHALIHTKKARKFAQKEAKSLMNQMNKNSKKQVVKIKKKLKALDKELTAAGKKSMKQILKEMSR